MVIIKVCSLGTAAVPITHEWVPWYYFEVNDAGKAEKLEEPYFPGGISLVKLLFGFTIPWNTMDATEGYNFGRGELGIFIFIVMAISAAIITVTGLNVAVITCVFVYFLLKTVLSIKDKALGIDLRQGESTD